MINRAKHAEIVGTGRKDKAYGVILNNAPNLQCNFKQHTKPMVLPCSQSPSFLFSTSVNVHHCP